MRNRRNKRFDPRRGQGTITLTSLMDILTTLLLFVLKSFVVDGESVTPVPGVTLPTSTSQQSAQPAIVIAIFDDVVMMDGHVVAQVSKASRERDLVIDALAARLRDARVQSLEIARMRGESKDDFIGKVSIQGDRNIHFAILQRVMYTCSQSGFENISLAVIEASS
ncbi:MAG TPA: biopolymer transporter ExbD [Candidatus Krumholzibacteria bacterium]|nr:biopolymer transporter ExbD [Candidatus Krumholzibacteria bacterium]